MKRLFLCHSAQDDDEVIVLARSLHLHGIGLWVDHERLFKLGQYTEDQARDIIADPAQCLGILYYATKKAQGSSFINEVEIPAALRRANHDPSFLFATLPRNVTHKELTESSLKLWGDDLSLRFTLPSIPAGPLRANSIHTATIELLDNLIPRFVQYDPIPLNLCTRDYIEPAANMALDVDATWLLRDDVSNLDSWERLRAALESMKIAIRRHKHRPTLAVTGSKHLTAGFMLGRVFSSPVVTELRTAQGDGYWSTMQAPIEEALLQEEIQLQDGPSREIAVGISTTDHDLRHTIDRYLQQTGIQCSARIWICPMGGPVRGAVTNARVAMAIANEIRSKLVAQVARCQAAKIHLFLAVPQSLAVFLGHLSNGLPPVQLHEYAGGKYVPSAFLS